MICICSLFPVRGDVLEVAETARCFGLLQAKNEIEVVVKKVYFKYRRMEMV